MVDNKQAKLFKILGVETRIRIIELLKQRGSLCVNEMSEVLGITPSAVSQHLRVLKYAGLVRNERKGIWLPYQVDPAALEQCREIISEICTCGCEGTGRIREAELGQADKDDLAKLEKYERKLLQELKAVRMRIKELKEET